MMKRLPAVFAVMFELTISGVAFGQQDPLYAQYINNPFLLNPAYAGSTNNLNTSAILREQWSGLPGSPKTFNANGHISLANNRMGAGIMISSDNVGATTVNEMFGSYAYRIRITQTKILSFGLQAGAANYQFDNSKLNPQNPTDPLFQGNTSVTKPMIGAGIILKDDKFFIGLSVPRMLRSTVQAGGVQQTLYTQTVYAMGSYLLPLRPRLYLKPSVLLKKVPGAPLSVDVNAAAILHENYSIGLLTRNFNTYGFMMQALIKNSFRLGYAFEVPTGKSVGTVYSTNEITLGFCIGVRTFHNSSNTLVGF
jgi:type IX secretion system PorP/SprF family membrane protein